MTQSMRPAWMKKPVLEPKKAERQEPEQMDLPLPTPKQPIRRRKKGKAVRDTSVEDDALGKTLRETRKSLGYTLQQVGYEFGMHYQQIQKYENGDIRVPATMLYKLAGFYGVSTGDLYTGMEQYVLETKGYGGPADTQDG